MSLFVCEKCNCIENTALCWYWSRLNKEKLCSKCDPEIKKWHDIFPREKFDKNKHEVIDDFVNYK